MNEATNNQADFDELLRQTVERVPTLYLKIQTYHDAGFSERELREIGLALVYSSPQFAHGTDGHSRLMLLARMARLMGFELGPDANLVLPSWAYRNGEQR